MKHMNSFRLAAATLTALVLSNQAFAQESPDPDKNNPRQVQTQPQQQNQQQQNPTQIGQPRQTNQNQTGQTTQSGQTGTQRTEVTGSAQGNKGPSLQGRVVRVGTNGQYFVQTSNGKELSFYTNPQTSYRRGTGNATIRDLRVGSNINVIYGMQDDRYLANEVSFVEQGQPGSTAEVNPGRNQIRGRITRMAANQIVITTSDGREVALQIDANNEVIAHYAQQGNQMMLLGLHAAREGAEPAQGGSSSTTTEVAPTAQGTTVEGTIVRVENNQVVVRGANGQEVILMSSPQSTYRLDDQAVRVNEFTAGQPVTVQYDVRDRNNYVRSIIGRRRR